MVVSRSPVISRRTASPSAGWRPRRLVDRGALHERLRGGGPLIVLSGHIHARESHARDTVLQLSAGALVEAPYESRSSTCRSPAAKSGSGDARGDRPAARRKDEMLAPADDMDLLEGWLCAS